MRFLSNIKKVVENEKKISLVIDNLLNIKNFCGLKIPLKNFQIFTGKRNMEKRKYKELWDSSILLTASLQSKHGIRQGPLLYELYSNYHYINFG